ncbi:MULTISPECIES: cache domain-containing protein [Pseudomonas]|uniref:cache domain-containing protein n=1 Tax=Pseudomonas TaxID=286 RepID=UPI000D8D4997|nr:MULTISPECIES: cache domain-containing protein [Pseudomonas]PYB96705.1 calcium channel protein [Pseudomonas sp. MB-090624]WBM31622.1 cache domain-containing protein [Pseudomonas sp. NY11382]
MRLIACLCSALLLLSYGSAKADEQQRARQLLQRAVEYYCVQGDIAFAAFSRQGEFIDNEHYVFVVDTNGTLLASGGTSATWIGRDVTQAFEPEVRAGFRKALSGDEGQVLSAEYRWMNAQDGRVERKRVFFQRVGDRVLAVGMYLPRATADQAKAFLNRAVEAIELEPEATLQAINNLSARFNEDDLYLFIIDLRNGRYVAHGYNRRLLGVEFTTIKDPEGKPVGAPILEMMKSRSEGGYGYRWRNPVTGKVEDKYALLRKTGHLLVATGYYLGSQ